MFERFTEKAIKVNNGFGKMLVPTGVVCRKQRQTELTQVSIFANSINY